MNAMCDMNQFFVVVSIPDESSTTLAIHFMHHMLIQFRLYHLVVLEDGNPFKENSIAICQALNLNYDIFAKRNHKGISIEYFRRFLNESVTIVAEKVGLTIYFPLLTLQLAMLKIVYQLTRHMFFAVFQRSVENLIYLLISILIRYPTWFRIISTLNSIISNLLIILVTFFPLFLKFLSSIVGSLMLSVLITLEIFLSCIPMILSWFKQLFRVIFLNIKMLS